MLQNMTYFENLAYCNRENRKYGDCQRARLAIKQHISTQTTVNIYYSGSYYIGMDSQWKYIEESVISAWILANHVQQVSTDREQIIVARFEDIQIFKVNLFECVWILETTVLLVTLY